MAHNCHAQIVAGWAVLVDVIFVVVGGSAGLIVAESAAHFDVLHMAVVQLVVPVA